MALAATKASVLVLGKYQLTREQDLCSQVAGLPHGPFLLSLLVLRVAASTPMDSNKHDVPPDNLNARVLRLKSSVWHQVNAYAWHHAPVQHGPLETQLQPACHCCDAKRLRKLYSILESHTAGCCCPAVYAGYDCRVASQGSCKYSRPTVASASLITGGL